MKTLKELKGAKELSKDEQKAINGGMNQCSKCPDGTICMNQACRPHTIND